ncbi:MAG: hypothetical protein GXO00_02375 [Candidatus Diapherotrites archaeon]|nr:hypothetical protein [Candidatus Diapherotrites archaeon]
MFDFLGFGKKKEEEKGGAAPKPAITLASPGAVTVTPPQQAGALTTSEGREISAVVEDLEKEVERLKDSLNVVKESLKSLNAKLEEIEKTLGQLASIYEIVMNQLNPFLDEDEKALPVRGPRVVKEQEPTTTQKNIEKKENTENSIKVSPAMESAEQTQRSDVVLPYIDVTNPKVIEVVIDWVKFMVEKVGHSGIEELLRYYVDIRWISEEVAEILKRYADGIRVDIEPEVDVVQLDPEDHAKSLEYILTIKELMSR